LEGTSAHGDEFYRTGRRASWIRISIRNRPRPAARRLGLWLGLSIALLAVFAAGMAIGYHSVYRPNTVAFLMSGT
jgi:hypothetical protein